MCTFWKACMYCICQWAIMIRVNPTAVKTWCSLQLGGKNMYMYRYIGYEIPKWHPFFFNPTCHPFLSFPLQSSSDEESGESEGSTSLPLSKLAYREGIGVVEGVKRGRRSRPPSRPTAPPPSQKLLLQHQQNRKRASALELRLKKRVRWRF